MTKFTKDTLSKSKKLGRFDHIGKTIRIFEILGGFDTGENATIADKLYEMDEDEAAHISGNAKVGSQFTKTGNEKKYRSWRTIQFEKLRCGQRSATLLEAERLHLEVTRTMGPEVAALFNVEDIVKLHPSKIVERVITEGVALFHPLQNPILLLRVLAELSPDPKPKISLGSPDPLRVTNQGDGRSEGMKLVQQLPIIKVNERFLLEIELQNAQMHDFFVFEYGNSEIARSRDNLPKLAIPMRYFKSYGDTIAVCKSDHTPLKADEALGQFGFCVIAAPKNDEQSLVGFLGLDAEADYWSVADIQTLTKNLRKYIASGEMNIKLALFDYDKHPA